jgi:hypothetical protein
MREHEPEKVRSLLQELASEMESTEQPPVKLEGTLRAAFRRRRGSRLRRRVAAAGLIAASIVILVLATRFAGNREAAPAPKVASAPMPELVTAPAPTAPEAAPQRRSEVRVARTTRRPAKVEKQRKPEVATDFIPVAGGNILGSLDRGYLVRVELPRTALRRFGLPMNEDRAVERVTADVLVGEDGLARAIRFVQ